MKYCSGHWFWAAVRHLLSTAMKPLFKAMERIFDFYAINATPSLQSCATRFWKTHHRTASIKNRDQRLFTAIYAKPLFRKSQEMLSFYWFSILDTTTKVLQGLQRWFVGWLCLACFGCAKRSRVRQNRRNMTWTMFCHSLLQLGLTFSIRIVADCVALFSQITRKLKRSITSEFTTVSAIIFIQCYVLAVFFHSNQMFQFYCYVSWS